MMIEDHRGRLVHSPKKRAPQLFEPLPYGHVIFAFLAILCTGWAIAFAYRAGVLTWGIVSLGIPVLVLTLLVMLRPIARTPRLGKMRGGRCPACGYDLRGLAADIQDGCCVCPECGGA